MVYEFEHAAIRGERMPDGLDMPEQWLFLNLRLLYRSVRLGLMDREQGRCEKNLVENAYKNMVYNKKYIDHVQGMYNKIGSAGSVYCKNRTLENADLFYEAVYGIPARTAKSQGEQP